MCSPQKILVISQLPNLGTSPIFIIFPPQIFLGNISKTVNSAKNGFSKQPLNSILDNLQSHKTNALRKGMNSDFLPDIQYNRGNPFWSIELALQKFCSPLKLLHDHLSGSWPSHTLHRIYRNKCLLHYLFLYPQLKT